jgi:O-antigen/teichoic acid export membrane protein
MMASALLLATGVVVARALGPTGKGFYDIAVGSAMLLTTFTGLSLPSGIFFYASRGPLAYRRLLLVLGSIALIEALVVMALLAIFGDTPVIAWMLPGGSRWTAALLIGLLLLALQSQQLLQGVVKGRGEFATFAGSEVLARGGTLILVGALFVAGIMQPEPYVLGFGLATLAAVGLLTSSVLAASESSDALPLPAMLRYSLPLFLGNVVQFLNYRVDIFFVKNYTGLSAVGTYTVAVWLAQIVWLVPNALASLVLRAVAERDGSGAMDRVAAVTRATLALSVLTGLALVVVGSVGIAPVFGDAFGGSVPALLLLMPGTILFCPTIVLSAYLNGIQRQAFTTWVACLALVVTGVLNILLVPQIGIRGAAIASTCSYTASTLATLLLVRRFNPGLSLSTLLVARGSDLRFALTALRAGAARVRGIPWHHDRSGRTL